MIRTLPVSAGILAIACFAAERMTFCYAPNAPLADNLLWLQYGFFIWFFVQIIFTSLSFLKQPDHHLDGLTLTAVLTTIVLFIVSIPLYNVILRLCNFIVELADHVLP